MIRTVVAFEKESARAQISDILEKGGCPVRAVCRTGAEVLRAVKRMGGGVVVCGCKLRDMTAENLAWELEDCASLLVIGRPPELELCESGNVFRMAAPIRPGELCGSVSMLLQLDDRRAHASVRRRTEEERELIVRAKELIMARQGLGEDEAYRLLQRRSMEESTPMHLVALQVLEGAD